MGTPDTTGGVLETAAAARQAVQAGEAAQLVGLGLSAERAADVARRENYDLAVNAVAAARVRGQTVASGLAQMMDEREIPKEPRERWTMIYAIARLAHAHGLEVRWPSDEGNGA